MSQSVLAYPSSTRNGLIERPLYSPEDFANREDALREIRVRVTDAQAKREIRQSVLLAWGVHGVGKTWLLQHVEHVYRFTQPKKGHKGTVAVLANFDRYDPEKDSIVDFIGQIVDTMVSILPPDAVAASDTLKSFYLLRSTGSGRIKDDEIANSFVAVIESLAKDYVPILLFDSMEKLESAYYEFFCWFEEFVLAPLVRWDHTLVILASRRELRRFRQFEVRRRLKKLPLEAFPRQSMAQQVRSEQIGNLLYPITYGHPFATWYLQAQLNEVRPKEQPFDETFLEERQTDLIDFLNNIESWLLIDVPDIDLRSRLVAVATLRYFHIRSLQMLVGQIEEDHELIEESDVTIQQLIGQLVDTNLVRWSMQNHGYEVEKTVRHLLNGILMRRQPTEYERRHQAALDLYANWIREIPWNSDRFVIEAAYHMGVISQVNPGFLAEAYARLTAILDRVFPATSGDVDLERIDTLWQTIRQDDELKHVSPPLFELLEGRLALLRGKPAEP